MHERDQVASPRLPEELARDQRAGRPAGAEGVARARALQRSAGNRSVGALLAREPDDPQPLDTKTPPAPAPAGGLASLDGIGVIPLVSAGFPSDRVGSGPMGGSSSGAGRVVPNSLTCTSSVGEHSPRLANAVATGASMAADVMIGDRLHLELTGAMVSSYSTGGGGEAPMESWTLSFLSSKQI